MLTLVPLLFLFLFLWLLLLLYLLLLLLLDLLLLSSPLLLPSLLLLPLLFTWRLVALTVQFVRAECVPSPHWAAMSQELSCRCHCLEDPSV